MVALWHVTDDFEDEEDKEEEGHTLYPNYCPICDGTCEFDEDDNPDKDNPNYWEEED